MMRWVYRLFLLYLVSLWAVPCTDGFKIVRLLAEFAVSEPSQGESSHYLEDLSLGSQDSHKVSRSTDNEQQAHEEDSCPPLCYCACCGMSVEERLSLDIARLTPPPSPSTSLIYPHLEDKPIDSYEDIWTPPKLALA